MKRAALALFALAWAACGDEPAARDAVDARDTEALDDADVPDSVDVLDTDDADADASATEDDADTSDTDPDTNGTEDTDTDTTEDTGPEVPLAGFGYITGPCGVIDDELYDEAPSLFVNALDFGDDPYDIEDFDRLTEHGQELILDGNAGGSSLYSEVFAMEVLARCELATLIATETEILYNVEGKITDILVEIRGAMVGVSVVRAVGFPKDAPYTVEQATTILERKLDDILVSSANVSDEHRWVKQILSVLAYADGHVDAIQAAWEALPEATRADTIVLVTVTHGDDAFIY